jgi:glycosyl transferase family 87
MRVRAPRIQNRRSLVTWPKAQLALSLVLLAAGWYYTLVILPAGLRAEAGPHDEQPVATVNCCGRDLYPSWYAARQVWVEHKSPYTEEATRAIQTAIYGKPITGTAIRVQQRFAYPLFAIIPMYPLAWLSFATAQKVVFAISVSLVIVTTLLWARTMDVRCTPAVCILVLATYPVIMGIALLQPTVIFLFFLALAACFAKSNRCMLAGVAAAVAVARPQLAIAVLVPLFFWTLADWRGRKRVVLGFTLTLAAQLGVVAFLQPAWLPQWLNAVQAYRSYAPTTLVLPSVPGVAVGMGVLLVLVLWRVRHDLELALALAAAGYQFMAPFQIYNEAILLPAALWLWKRRQVLAETMLSRMPYRLVSLVFSCAMIMTALACVLHSLYQLPVLLFILLGFTPLLAVGIYIGQHFVPERELALIKTGGAG